MAATDRASGTSRAGNAGAGNPASGSLLFSAAVAALLLMALMLAGRGLDSPGLYYDEAVQARPALEFATGRVRASPLPVADPS